MFFRIRLHANCCIKIIWQGINENIITTDEAQLHLYDCYRKRLIYNWNIPKCRESRECFPKDFIARVELSYNRKLNKEIRNNGKINFDYLQTYVLILIFKTDIPSSKQSS